MTRFGPLEARGSTLVLGDAGGHHAELTASALVLREFQEEPVSIDWSRVERITLSVPETRFRLPGLVGTVGLAVLGGVTGDMGVAGEIDDGTLRVSIAGADPVEMPITRHHVGGYWAKSVRAATALLNRLGTDPEARQLLADPERVVKLLASGR